MVTLNQSLINRNTRNEIHFKEINRHSDPFTCQILGRKVGENSRARRVMTVSQPHVLTCNPEDPTTVYFAKRSGSEGKKQGPCIDPWGFQFRVADIRFGISRYIYMFSYLHSM